MYLSYEGAVPVAGIFHYVEKYSGRVYFVYPDIGLFSAGAVKDFMETASGYEKFFECPSVEFPYPVVLIDVLHGTAKDFSEGLFFSVAGYAYGLCLGAAELPYHVFYQLPYEIVFQRDFALFLEVLFFGHGSPVGKGYAVVPLSPERIVAVARPFSSVRIELFPCPPRHIQCSGIVHGEFFTLFFSVFLTLRREQRSVIETAVIGFVLFLHVGFVFCFGANEAFYFCRGVVYLYELPAVMPVSIFLPAGLLLIGIYSLHDV